MGSLAPAGRLRRPLRAWAALLKADLDQLSKSWVLRGWVAALALTAFFGLVRALGGHREVPLPASQVLTQHLQLYLLVWSTVIIVLCAGAVSLETEIIADSILCRACTRTQYLLAKLVSRSAAVVGIYALFAGAAAYCAWRYGTRDITWQTAATGVGIVGMAILMLVSISLTFSVVFNNTIFAVVGMLLLWYVAGSVFNFLGAGYLSPIGLVGNLPRILRDTNAPQVIQCRATPSTVTVIFSKQVNPAQAQDVENYLVECPAGTKWIPGTATYDPSQTRVLLGGLELPAGALVKVTVRGVTDAAGNDISPTANTATARVGAGVEGEDGLAGTEGESDEASAPAPPRRGRGRGRDERGPLRLLECAATPASLRLTFSRQVQRGEAENPDNYVVESPVGHTLKPAAAVYDPATRTVLLSGLTLTAGVPVKVTVRDVRDAEGNPIASPHNTALYTEVTTWKYFLGFGIPALGFALVALAWFSRRDL
ncbi:MAG: Ig-like domain-containing protein [Armatimonadota bacterium]|nr:Ig-like domain-containing protein [Armatimonadota bacterium]